MHTLQFERRLVDLQGMYVVAALAETITLMREIDEVIDAHGGWPIK